MSLLCRLSRTVPCHISGKIFAPATARHPQRAAAPCRRGRVRTAPHLHPSRHSCPAAGDYVPATPCSPVVCPEPVSGLPPYRAASAGIRGSRPDRSHTPVRLPPDTAGNSRTFPAEPFHFAAGDSLPAPPLPRTPAAPPAASPVRDFPCRDRWGLFSKVPAKMTRFCEDPAYPARLCHR